MFLVLVSNNSLASEPVSQSPLHQITGESVEVPLQKGGAIKGKWLDSLSFMDISNFSAVNLSAFEGDISDFFSSLEGRMSDLAEVVQSNIDNLSNLVVVDLGDLIGVREANASTVSEVVEEEETPRRLAVLDIYSSVAQLDKLKEILHGENGILNQSQ